MKKIITLLAPLIILVACKQQGKENYFSGTIGYAYTYSSDSLSADSLAKVRPATSLFRYDTMGYQGMFLGADTITYYYSGRQNKCVSKTGNTNKYECEDYGVTNDSVLSWKIYDTDEKVLGQKCKILEMQKSSSWVKYYVSTETKIAPLTYQYHRAYNWDFYGDKAGGGLILKLEHRFKRFTLHGVATITEARNGFTALEMNEQAIASVCK